MGPIIQYPIYNLDVEEFWFIHEYDNPQIARGIVSYNIPIQSYIDISDSGDDYHVPLNGYGFNLRCHNGLFSEYSSAGFTKDDIIPYTHTIKVRYGNFGHGYNGSHGFMKIQGFYINKSNIGMSIDSNNNLLVPHFREWPRLAIRNCKGLYITQSLYLDNNLDIVINDNSSYESWQKSLHNHTSFYYLDLIAYALGIGELPILTFGYPHTYLYNFLMGHMHYGQPETTQPNIPVYSLLFHNIFVDDGYQYPDIGQSHRNGATPYYGGLQLNFSVPATNSIKDFHGYNFTAGHPISFGGTID